MHQACSSEKSKEDFASKYARSGPYHLFLTRVEESKKTHRQNFSVTFPEILDKSLGEIVNSLHLTYILDFEWLYSQYVLADQCTDMVILCGDRLDEKEINSNITVKHVDMPSEYGCHHTKMTILQYKDNGIRIIISTANLFLEDWENRTQGLWISPHLPPLPKSAKPVDGNSRTNFKKDLLRYLSKYQNPVLKQWMKQWMKPWMKIVEKTDFSAVNVFLLTCIPGCYKNIEADFWGYKKLAQVLSQHVTLPPDASQWPVIAQSSSVGSYGRKYECWLSRELVLSMSQDTTQDLKSQPKFQFIYPSVNNYEQSFDFQNSTCCFSYSMEVHSKQQWLKSYLYQWKATRTGRDKAMPHIKSYTRVSPDLKSIPWFVLTSANLSKAGWGVQRYSYSEGYSYSVANYEAGVVFLPKFITGTTTFPISEDEVDPAIPIFPIPYDLPLYQYDSSDSPFITREFHQE